MKNRFCTLVLIIAFTVPTLLAQKIHPDSIAKYTDWLYTSMNIADKANHSRAFWERNVELALETRRDMPWGKIIPAREWLHFVLPVRVNNELPDTSRMAFYREIGPRVKNMTMEQAALEVNHWAHEKATYRPSDARTSSPLATVRTTFGRCGEESTLVVAAMRAVGIPARQIYTPRWAHTDDNHAWVEVWVDGSWHFLGACEPEPVLDLGWFNEPASQGLLMATNVIGKYDGPEQQIYRDSCYTRINITDNYARTRKASVKVVDKSGRPAAHTPVSFRIYNYAEFYPLFSTLTDANGHAELVCGYGDVLAWATSPDGTEYGMVRIAASDTEDALLTLSANPLELPLEIIITPPAPSPLKPKITPEQIAANDARKKAEDSIRNSTMARFLTKNKADALVVDWADDAEFVAHVLAESYGNHSVMTRFISAVPHNRRHEARVWLENLRAKDWRDITWPIIDDFFLSRTSSINPRIANESLSPWLKEFDKEITTELRKGLSESPAAVEKWILKNIRIDDDHNPNHFCIAPEAVLRTRTADTHSRDIFYVALCRWLGFDAQIDPVTSQVLARQSPDDEYHIAFSIANKPAESINVKFAYDPEATPTNPKYYRHFTISEIVNGQPQLLNYPEDADWRSVFSSGIDLQAGIYLLTTGRRLADGSVKTQLTEFKVNPTDSVVEVPLIIPVETNNISIIGSFNADPLLPLTGRGIFVAAFIKPNHEPSAHFINELCDNKAQIEKLGRSIILITASDDEAQYISNQYELPKNVKLTTNTDFTWLADLATEFEQEFNNDTLPISIVADSFNRVMYLSKGYRPGAIDQIHDTLTRLIK